MKHWSHAHIAAAHGSAPMNTWRIHSSVITSRSVLRAVGGARFYEILGDAFGRFF